ncbi:MAG: phenylalanine--tRNA ligase subunit alpha, partial [Enterobacterales bacterium]|nr:phenylalanine--tRNA ligase subunit alpha [Enterobacterales bacterium]
MPHLAELVAQAKAAVENAQDIATLDNVRVEYLGKKGHLTLQMTSLRELPAEERPAAGAVINQAKQEVQEALNARKSDLESAALNARLAEETIDV